ncbi:MAG TPA: putative sulfate/molybdate transporter [Gemmatimonadales bacterium]|nr:putative sulfate/molybdate transporter [Gemmatimonadales bacterium]
MDAPAPRALRFDRNEFSGAFGDLGTDFPLIVGMVAAAGLDGASVLIAYGLMEIGTGLYYRLPIPVQPLKAVAVIVITQHIGGAVLRGAGLAIGIAMLLLSALGLLDWLARVVPKAVIRGIQLGLGLQLASIALRDYVGADESAGWWLAGLAFIIIVALLGNRRLPAGVPVIALGLIYALAFKIDLPRLVAATGIHLPQLSAPSISDVAQGFVLLALPQIPLSLGNSILATRQIVHDYFPDVDLSVRKIGFTYALMNLINPFIGGVPTCHGSGGVAGHYAFGGRTGGSVVIYGTVFLVLGLFFGGAFTEIVKVFPLPVLGVLLLFEGLYLIVLIGDVAPVVTELRLAALVGACAAFLPYGYVIGLVVGTALFYLGRRGLTGFAR